MQREREERAERDFKEILAKRCKGDKICPHAEENLVTFAQQQQLSVADITIKSMKS
jgi:hypothetical protein